MAIERYGSKTDVVVKLVLVFFVCLLSFSIGTFVGKKFSDNQHKLAKFEPEAAGGHEVAATEGEHKTKTMTDEEFAKLAEEFVADDEGSRAPANDGHGAAADTHGAPAKKAGKDTHGAPAKDDHAAAPKKDEHGAPAKKEAHAAAPKKGEHGAPAKKDDHAAAPKKDEHGAPAKKDDHAAQPTKVAEKVARGQKVEFKAEGSGSRIPAALPKEIGSSAIGKYTVQVGSYQTEEEAKKRTEALKEQTFSAFYVEAKVKDKAWYRVSVGLFNTQKEAESYMKDLLERKKVPSAIVQKISK